jgi:hypothetical protein
MADESHLRQHHRRSNIAWTVFAVLAAFYLWTEHRAHLLGVLPFVLLLACPLMHLFMHHGHRHQQGSEPQRDAQGEQGEQP